MTIKYYDDNAESLFAMYSSLKGAVRAERIAEDANYEGIRVKFVGYLENARIPIQLDLGFGDTITPAPADTEIPSLLNTSP